VNDGGRGLRWGRLLRRLGGDVNRGSRGRSRRGRGSRRSSRRRRRRRRSSRMHGASRGSLLIITVVAITVVIAIVASSGGGSGRRGRRGQVGRVALGLAVLGQSLTLLHGVAAQIKVLGLVLAGAANSPVTGDVVAVRLENA
jgi:hypothetical protein